EMPRKFCLGIVQHLALQQGRKLLPRLAAPLCFRRAFTLQPLLLVLLVLPTQVIGLGQIDLLLTAPVPAGRCVVLTAPGLAIGRAAVASPALRVRLRLALMYAWLWLRLLEAELQQLVFQRRGHRASLLGCVSRMSGSRRAANAPTGPGGRHRKLRRTGAFSSAAAAVRSTGRSRVDHARCRGPAPCVAAAIPARSGAAPDRSPPH